MTAQAAVPTKAPPPQAHASAVSGRTLARKCACGASPRLDGECDDCRKKKGMGLHRQEAGEAHESVAPRAVHEVLGSPGQALDPDARQKMESSFGHDFGNVRVHTDARAAESARSVNAVAYAVGRDIVFQSGRYAPQTSAGERLLAHELAHVVQQQGQSSTGPLEISQEDDAAEVEARSIADAVLRGDDAQPERKAASALSRSPVRVAREADAAARDGACNAEQRGSVELPPVSCCTRRMREELEALRAGARPIVAAAISALDRPGSVAGALRAHFAIGPDDSARIDTVKTHFRAMRDMMDDSDVTFLCREQSEPPCTLPGKRNYAISTSCHLSTPILSMFCGDYEGSVSGAPFLAGRDWVQTMIHEYAHMACPRMGVILSACPNPSGPCEYYAESPGYPREPDSAVKNADSYANFARTVTEGAPASSLSSSGGSWVPWLIGGIAVVAAIAGVIAAVVASQKN